MASRFHLTAVTPNSVIFDGEAVGLTVRITEGEIGVLANHADLLAGIAEGKLVIRTDRESLTFGLSRGFIRVSGGSAVIIADGTE